MRGEGSAPDPAKRGMDARYCFHCRNEGSGLLGVQPAEMRKCGAFSIVWPGHISLLLSWPPGLINTAISIDSTSSPGQILARGFSVSGWKGSRVRETEVTADITKYIVSQGVERFQCSKVSLLGNGNDIATLRCHRGNASRSRWLPACSWCWK